MTEPADPATWQWLSGSLAILGGALGIWIALLRRKLAAKAGEIEALKTDHSERKRLEGETRIFSGLAERLSEARSPQEAGRAILDAADALLGWDAAFIHVFSADRQRVIPILSCDLVNGVRVENDPAENYQENKLHETDHYVLRSGPALILRGTDIGSNLPLKTFGDRSRRSSSLMFVPVRSQGAVVGSLSIQSYREMAYERPCLKLLQRLADHAGGALERIWEQRRAQEALRVSEERFAKAFRSSPIAMSITTLDEGRYLDVNASFLRLLGYEMEEVAGKTSLELDIWAGEADRLRMVSQLKRDGRIEEMELKLRTKIGEWKTILASLEPIDLDGQRAIIGILIDVTARLNLEEQLRHAQKLEAIGQLAAGVAHDFNNIMTVIQGRASLLEALPPDKALLADSLKEILHASERAANLTRQLLLFSRKQAIQAQTLDLNEVIAGLSKMLQRLLGEDIALQAHCASNPLTIIGDPGMIEQVLMNLAVNARDAMPKGGSLIVQTYETPASQAEVAARFPEVQPGQFACLSVTDTGCGMDEKTQSRMFEPFFTTKEAGKGTGLGLATVYGIVRQHHGWLEVKSRPGEGSTFRIYFPAQAAAAEAPRAAPAPPSIPPGNETVLLVEDEDSLRNLAREVLQKNGYRVLTAASGVEALQVWEEHMLGIALVFTDMVMPKGVSGRELGEKLKADRPDLKLIYTSGYSLDVAGKDLLLTEGVNFLQKPYLPRTLLQIVRAALQPESRARSAAPRRQFEAD